MQNQEVKTTTAPKNWNDCRTLEEQSKWLYEYHWSEIENKISFWEQDHPGILNLEPMEHQFLLAIIGEIHMDHDLYALPHQLRSMAFDFVDFLSKEEGLDRATKYKYSQRVKTLIGLSERLSLITQRLPSIDRFALENVL